MCHSPLYCLWDDPTLCPMHRPIYCPHGHLAVDKLWNTEKKSNENIIEGKILNSTGTRHNLIVIPYKMSQ